MSRRESLGALSCALSGEATWEAGELSQPGRGVQRGLVPELGVQTQGEERAGRKYKNREVTPCCSSTVTV